MWTGRGHLAPTGLERMLQTTRQGVQLNAPTTLGAKSPLPPLPKGGFIPLTLISPARGEKIQTLIPLAPFKKGGIGSWHAGFLLPQEWHFVGPSTGSGRTDYSPHSYLSLKGREDLGRGDCFVVLHSGSTPHNDMGLFANRPYSWGWSGCSKLPARALSRTPLQRWG